MRKDIPGRPDRRGRIERLSWSGPTCLSARAPAYLVAVLAVLLIVVPPSASAQTCDVTAKVVALDQVIVYNRLGAFNPAGMIFALARDVFPLGTPSANEMLGASCASVSCSAGLVQLRATKRPRPLTLRVNEGQTLCVTLTNLLHPTVIADAANAPAGIGLPPFQAEQPVTRAVGLHVHGMEWASGPQDDGSNVGANGSSLAEPGGSPRTYRLRATKEGAYTITSGPNLGGEGGSGAIASGLFGVLNVEPAGSEWYRSQLTREEMVMAADHDGNGSLAAAVLASELTAEGHPILNYDAVYPSGHPYAGDPILALLKNGEIVHNELNAVVTGPGRGGLSEPLAPTEVYPNRGEPFREFTVVFHDEVKVVQAFPGWFDPLQFTLGSVKDGFAINYGTGGIGAEIIANRLGVGPMSECVECKYEEFFLSSWAVGDPAMIVDAPANAGLEACDPNLVSCAETGPKATKAFYPDDPANVWHGYLNDRTKIRNVHLGTEHHIFHLHAHQWLFAQLDNKSNYLDAQLIGPGSSFTYEISYGGGGNRNKTAGDSIFHCHFYPHFAQGMWGLWRVHDTFEMGSELFADGRVMSRGLPDAEICFDPAEGGALAPAAGGAFCGGYDPDGNPIAGGTPVPGVVPIPTKAMAPMPGRYVAAVDHDDDPVTADRQVPFMGYPFYIPGIAGHRPPTPPLDLVADGGIPRHVITAGTAHQVQTPTDFDKVLESVTGHQLPESGTPAEKAAMAFHGVQPGGALHGSFLPNGSAASFEVNGLPPVPGAPFADPCRGDLWNGGVGAPMNSSPRKYKTSVIELDMDLNKVGWHFNQSRILVLDGDVEATLSGARAPEPMVLRANTGECVEFDHTNRVPNVYQLDDFQVKTPTDVIGQHIHLVKFDVTSSDGSGNGWNYEDGTLSRDEIAERIHALQAPGGGWTGATLGAASFRTTRQRWYIDPGWSGNVFTHDHFGPSTHQQAGLYGTVLIEPKGSTWRDPMTGVAFGGREDGGPTSWRADIITGDDAWREFYLEFADFALAYRGQDDGGALNAAGTPVNPSDRVAVGLPYLLEPCPPGAVAAGPNGCRPEAISAADPGTMLVNYRNEPLALRVRDPQTNAQALAVDTDGDGLPNPEAGDLSHAFSSAVTRADARLNTPPSAWPYNGAAIQTPNQGALAGDPFTPLLRAYEDDKVYLRVQVGAHEEGHNFSINGVRWLQQWASPSSGFRNSQAAGISEYFVFKVPGLGAVKGGQPFEDYLYQTGSSVEARWNGTWGLMRSYPDLVPDLLPLPNNPDGKAPPMSTTGSGKNAKPDFAGVCPVIAPVRSYDVVAVRAADVLPGGAIEYHPELVDPTGMLYVLKSDIDPKTGQLLPGRRVEPLVLRAAAGECVQVKLTNGLQGAPLDLEGFSALPMIVNQFNANQIAPSSEVGLHAQLVQYDMSGGDGMNVGWNPIQTVAPGGVVTYQWYAGQVVYDAVTKKWRGVPVEFGAANLTASDPIKGSSKGLIGALVVEPQGSFWEEDAEPELTRASATVFKYGACEARLSLTCSADSECVDDTVKVCSGDNTTTCSRARDCRSVGGTCGAQSLGACQGQDPLFRDFVLMFQDDVNMRFKVDGSAVPTVADEEDSEDSGQKGVNYRTDPIWLRLNVGPTADTGVTRAVNYANAFAGEPVTPVFTASSCEPVRLRVLKPGGHNRNSVFTLSGHNWARHPYNADSTAIDGNNWKTFWHGEQMGHGPSNHFDVVPLGGCKEPGDYLYRDMVPVHVDNGEWGILRVTPQP